MTNKLKPKFDLKTMEKQLSINNEEKKKISYAYIKYIYKSVYFDFKKLYQEIIAQPFYQFRHWKHSIWQMVFDHLTKKEKKNHLQI